MMKIQELRAPLIGVIILGLVVLGLAIAVIDQQITNSRLSNEVLQRRQTLTSMTRETVAYQKLTGNYDELSLKIGGRYRSITWSKQMPFMVNQITGIMKTRDILVETLRPEPITTTADGISRFPLRIGFKAKLADLSKVTQEIEKIVPILHIEQINIRAADKSDMLQADMTISSFGVLDEKAPEVDRLKLDQKKAESPVEDDSKSDEKKDEQKSADSSPDKDSKSHRGSI